MVRGPVARVPGHGSPCALSLAVENFSFGLGSGENPTETWDDGREGGEAAFT